MIQALGVCWCVGRMGLICASSVCEVVSLLLFLIFVWCQSNKYVPWWRYSHLAWYVESSMHQVQQVRMLIFTWVWIHVYVCVCICVHMHIMHSHIPQHAAYAQASAVCHHNGFDKVTNRATLPRPQSISSKQGLSNFIVFVNGRDNGSSRDGRRRSGFLVFFNLILYASLHISCLFRPICTLLLLRFCARAVFMCAARYGLYVCVHISVIRPIHVCTHKRDDSHTCVNT